MRHVRLGETELNVSRICFGTWQTGGEWGAIDTEQAKSAARRALELGINFFDTAQAYGWGISERLLGEALAPEIRSRRDEIVIATKGGLTQDDDRPRNAGRDWLRRGIEQSLRELGTDYVDIYQPHWPDPGTPIEETAGALQEFVDEGKTRYVGVSNFGVAELEALGEYRRADTLQPPYHMLRREIEDEILPYCREHAIGVLVYSPLASGLLSGKFDPEREFAAEDWRKGSSTFDPDAIERNLAIIGELGRYAEQRGWTLPQLAIAWVLSAPGVDVAIAGARVPEHIEGTAPAGDFELTEEDRGEIDEILEGAVPLGGPSPESK
ncbi:MAG TPA: aldo/keto reductase [Solirubrobacterales bacterium]|nr:aldo/keto reductase [Solirubrobacterales bacterium]